MRSITKLLLIAAFCGVGYLAHKTYLDRSREAESLKFSLESLKKEIEHLQQIQKPAALPCVSGQPVKTWGSLQSELKDAVVQVFSEVAEFNWLEPYKSPGQYNSSGSGFFITEQGDMITNAHVVDQAKAVSIQIPSFGKRRFEVDLKGVSAERDLALICLKPKDLEEVKMILDKIPALSIGNSDAVHRADEIMALGYPLGQQSLKSTNGIVSGREQIGGQHMIQISAPINPGSSGGPSINCQGEYIGVNSAGVPGAQNVGYIIPSNEVQLFLHHIKQMPDANKVKFLRKPYLGILFNFASESLTSFLGNPQPGGLYVAGVQRNSPLEKAGVQPGDMIYEIDGYRLDLFGEMNVPWSEDKIAVTDYISRLMLGDKVNLRTYRKGTERHVALNFSESELGPIRRMYPGYEKIDYEVIGGLVVMPLALNHLPILVQVAPELTRYLEIQNQMDGALIVTHVFPTSPAARSRTLGTGAILSEVNGKPVKTLEEFRNAIKDSVKSNFLTIKTQQNIFAVLPFNQILDEEKRLSEHFYYPLSALISELLVERQRLSDEAKKKA